MIKDKTKIFKALVSLALAQSSTDTKTTMLKHIDSSFKNTTKKEYGIDVELIQAAPEFDYDNDSESECCSYLEFKSEDLSCIVALEGTWGSYDGYVFKDWYFCRSQPVTKLEYFRE